ncbi:MAG: hypothetical protein S4CHLAM2_16210 [Chlamydiales bacterium]|nr:hypothetical protein [Chlamydiales bacterium]
MATATDHISPGCCLALRHSDTCRQIKQSALLITLAIAIIGTIGAVLGVLAFQGYNLGGINALVTLAGEHAVYLTLIGGTSLLLIAITLVASVMRNSANQQLTQREVDRLNLRDWLDDEMIADKLQPGQFWDFPEGYRTAQQEHPAVFGMVVKNQEGAIEIYAFKTADAAAAKKLKLSDGQAAFSTSRAYPRSYVNRLTDSEQVRAFEEQPLKEGECFGQIFESIYAAKRIENGVEKVRFFKTSEAREHFVRGFTDRRVVEALLRAFMATQLKSIPKNKLFCFEDRPGRHAICYNESGNLLCDYFVTAQERDAYAFALRQRGFIGVQTHASSHTSDGSWDSSQVVFL